MNSDIKVQATLHFLKVVKQLSKKYPSLKKDVERLIAQISANPFSGKPIGRNCYKIRLKISSKNTGKSGGARVITFVALIEKKVVLVDIFDKSDADNIPDKYLIELLKKLKDNIV